MPEPSGVFPREGGGRQGWCHFNSQLLCKSLQTPSLYHQFRRVQSPKHQNEFGTSAVQSSQVHLRSQGHHLYQAMPPQCEIECLSILALQGVPAVQSVLIEGSAEMLILYWGGWGEAVVFPAQD